ncbi:MAG: cytotoxic translational repressor of toxin-antitoxin stability system [Patescibacteria group bacterium]
MDKISKALKKFTPKERIWVKFVLGNIQSNNFQGLDIKKLKGWDDIFRVRKGDIRIIYKLDSIKKIHILTIGRRKENTYKKGT